MPPHRLGRDSIPENRRVGSASGAHLFGRCQAAGASRSASSHRGCTTEDTRLETEAAERERRGGGGAQEREAVRAQGEREKKRERERVKKERWEEVRGGLY